MEPILKMRDDGTIELIHHGIKGQKWGVENGPPYPLDDSISTGKRLKNIEENAKKIKGSKKTSITAAIAGSVGVLGTQAGKGVASIKSIKSSDKEEQKLYNDIKKSINDPNTVASIAYSELDRDYNRQLRKAKEEIDLSDIPDKDLQQRVNRLNLEKNYKELTVKDIDTGRDIARNIITGVSAVSGLAISGLTIALLIKKLKNK